MGQFFWLHAKKLFRASLCSSCLASHLLCPFCHVFVKQNSGLQYVMAWKDIFAVMAKRLINIFLILVLSVQVLPVQQMGRALFSNLFNEEIPHSVDLEKDCCKKMQGKSEFIDWAAGPVLIATSIELRLPILDDAAIPHNHSNEILVPPPNC